MPVRKTLIQSYKEAGKNLTPAKAKEIAVEYLQQDDAVLDLSLKWIRYDDLEITADTYQVLFDKVKEYGLSDNPPTYEEFVKNDF